MKTKRLDGRECQVAKKVVFKARFRDLYYKNLPYGYDKYYYEHIFRFKPITKIKQYDRMSTKMVEVSVMWFDKTHTIIYTSDWEELTERTHKKLKKYKDEEFLIEGWFYTYKYKWKTKGPFFRPRLIGVLKKNGKKIRIL